MLWKHVVKFGVGYLLAWSIVGLLQHTLWVYKGEAILFAFGVDCRSPIKAALLLPEGMDCTNVTDYKEQLILSLLSVRELAVSNMQLAQCYYKKYYDKQVDIF